MFFTGGIFLPIGALLELILKEPAKTVGRLALFDPQILSVVTFTLKQALLSTFVSVLLGLPLGWICARSASPRMQSLLQILLALPYGIPTVVVAMTVTAWLGNSGLLASLGWGYSLKAVILAHVLLNAPWIALGICQAKVQIPRAQIEASETLGANFWQRFRWIEWPHLQWSLFSSSVQVFSLCVMSFALVLILGGGPPVETLETEIYSRIRLGSLDLRGAAACAFWQLLLTLIPWVTLHWFSRRAKILEKATPCFDPRRRTFSWVPALLASMFLLPYVTLYRFAALQLWSTSEFFNEISGPLAVSLKLAGAVAVVTLLTALSALISRPSLKGADLLFTLPAGISILVLGLGFWLAYGRWLDPFEGSFTAMLALQVTTTFPLAYRSLWALSQGTQTPALEAARTLGATPVQAFMTVEWPRWRGPILRVAAVAAGVSLGEVAAVSLFYSENLVPIPLLISRWMGQYRFQEAQALAVFLLIACTALTAAVATSGTFLRRQDRLS